MSLLLGSNRVKERRVYSEPGAPSSLSRLNVLFTLSLPIYTLHRTFFLAHKTESSRLFRRMMSVGPSAAMPSIREATPRRPRPSRRP